jgi:hypothetical protein
MPDRRPESLPTGPGPPTIGIGRWRDGLGLKLSFERNSIKVIGFRGSYTIMRIAAFWVMTYFHMKGKETEAILTKGSKRLEGAMEEVKRIERQVLFDEILERTVRRNS